MKLIFPALKTVLKHKLISTHFLKKGMGTFFSFLKAFCFNFLHLLKTVTAAFCFFVFHNALFFGYFILHIGKYIINGHSV